MLIDHTTAFETYSSVDDVMRFGATPADQTFLDAPVATRPSSGGVLPGLLIETADGFRQARSLRPGDMVQSYDGGLREVVNVRCCVPRLTAMVHVPAGVLGNDADLTLPSDTLVGLEGALAEDVFSLPVVTAKLVALIGHHGINAALPQNMARIHIQCDEEELLWAEGGMILNANEAQEDGFYELLSFAQTRQLVAAGADSDTAWDTVSLMTEEQAEQRSDVAATSEDDAADFDLPFALPLKLPRFDPLDLLFGRYAA